MLTYSELKKIKTFDDRLRYLSLAGTLFKETFGVYRNLNQRFYKSSSWKIVRNTVITRDYGFDLGVEGHPIVGGIYVHHMNPIEKKDLINEEGWNKILNPDLLISTSFNTHRIIHYGIHTSNEYTINERTPGDTTLW